jgi:hypothetical protein
MLFEKTTKPLQPSQCFVLMPFAAQYEEIYFDIIKPALQSLGIDCIRADELYKSTPIIQDIWEGIQTSGFIIADMTGRNANVFYELGLAHGIGKEVILLTQSLEDVPFDLRHLRCLTYKHSFRGLRKLAEDLKKILASTPLLARLPVEVLTDRFVSHFNSEKLLLRLEFGPDRGMRTQVRERFSVTAVGRDMAYHYKKLQVNGKVSDVRFDRGVTEARLIFPGLYILDSKLDPPIVTDQRGDFELSYILENCFPDEREFWFVNVEGSMEELALEFSFDASLDVSDLKALVKTQTSETLHDIQPTAISPATQNEFQWIGKSFSKDDCIMFRWRWR